VAIFVELSITERTALLKLLAKALKSARDRRGGTADPI
jgi:hypothetical protein